MSLKYCGRKVYDKRNGQICRPQKCRVKFGKNLRSKNLGHSQIFRPQNFSKCQIVSGYYLDTIWILSGYHPDTIWIFGPDGQYQRKA